MKQNSGYALKFLAVSLVGTGIFYIWAFGIVLKNSFVTEGTENRLGIENYLTVFQNKAFWIASRNSLLFLGICVSLLLILSLGAALFLRENCRIHRILRKGFLIPLAIPASAVVFLWNLMFDVRGWLNHFLSFRDISGTDWMYSKWALWILILVYIWKNFGYYVILWTAALSQIPTELYEQARSDGAGRRQLLKYMTLPLLKPYFYYILLFAIVSGFKTFREAYLAAGDYPDQRIYMVQHFMNNWYREMNFDSLAAATCILVAFLVFVTMIIRKSLYDREGRGRKV